MAGELSRKMLAAAYYRHEVMSEVIERGWQSPIGFDGHSQKAIDDLVKEFCYLRENELYKHEVCTTECKVSTRLIYTYFTLIAG